MVGGGRHGGAHLGAGPTSRCGSGVQGGGQNSPLRRFLVPGRVIGHLEGVRASTVKFGGFNRVAIFVKLMTAGSRL